LADDGVIIVVLFFGFLAFLVWMQKQSQPAISLEELEEVKRWRRGR